MQHWNLLEIEAPGGTRNPVVLLSENAARAVLIRIEPGQDLGSHQVKEQAWIVVVDGSVRVRASDGNIEAGAGTLFHFEANERRAVESDGGARILLVLAPWPGPGHYRGEERAAGRA